MPAENLTFSCIHCQIRLTVPASLAGVTGPCPNCRGTITAPSAPSPGTVEAETLPPPSSPPVAAPSASPLPATEAADSNSTATPRSPEPTPAAADDDSPLPGGPKVRPEPRRLPDRPQLIPIPARRNTSDKQLIRSAATQPESNRRPYRLVDALLPSIFLVLAVAVIGTLLYFYAPGSPGQRLAGASRPLVVQYPPKGTPPSPRKPFIPDENVGHVPEIPPGFPPPADFSAERPPPPAIAANEMLESFLGAKDAASRLNQVEPAATVEELAATLLGKELPELAQIVPDLPQQHPEEEMTEFPYRVSFFMKDAPVSEFAILVRQRGAQPPRVFLPAFLDLVGGRLADFVGKPNTLPPARFHVYLEPIDDCYEMDIPGADRKFTLKLMASPVGKEAARAYAANVSRLRKLVEDPNYPIRWGMRRRATVSVQWNHQEDPARPYLELVDITSPDWNP